MEISNQAQGEVVVIAPAGRIDHATAGDFERAVVPLLDASTGPRAGLVFDFERVPYISSVGLRVLVIASKALRARGARVAVASMQPVVVEVFGICRFGSVVETFPTVDDAVAALSGAASAGTPPPS